MIAAEIVRAASKGMPKTKIMYSARLNYKQLTRYLDGLTKEGLLHSDDKGAVFTTTERGMAFLNSYDRVEGLSEELAEKQREMHQFFRTVPEPRRRQGDGRHEEDDQAQNIFARVLGSVRPEKRKSARD
jgi:predicted transcriptional regulator